MTALGAHTTNTGNRGGYGEFVTAKPRVVCSVDDGGMLLEAKQKSNGHTVTVFRDTTVYLEAPGDINNSEATWEQMADYWYNEHNNGGLKRKWLENPADYYTITNEQGSSDPQSMWNLVQYEREVMRLANEDGFKVAVLSLAGGNPSSLELWVEFYSDFILEAWAAGNIYARHAYGEDLGDGKANLVYPAGTLIGNVDMSGKVIPGNPSRPFEEAQWMDAHGHKGGIVIKECGLDGGQGFAGPERFTEQMTGYERQVRILDPGGYFIGICMWTLGAWKTSDAVWSAAIPDPWLIPYMLDNPTSPWTPPEPGTSPPPTDQRLVDLLFTGHGIQDVGEANASWWDHNNVQVPISPAGGQRWQFTEWLGQNPCSDGKPHNNYTAPEGVHMGRDLSAQLPPDEHRYYNSAGRTYHLFGPRGTWRVRYEFDVTLETKGDIELFFQFWGDWADIEGGVKVPKPDPDHAHIELFIDDRGRESWITPKYIEHNSYTYKVKNLEAGSHVIGFGVETCFAPEGGVNGLFIQRFASFFTVAGTEPLPPSGNHRVVIYKIAQEHVKTDWELIAAFAHDEFKRTQTASTDDMLTMLNEGNEESYAIVVDPSLASQAEAISALTAAGYSWLPKYMTTEPGNPGPAPFRFEGWPCEYMKFTQRFAANPDDYSQFCDSAGLCLPGHDGVDLKAPDGSKIYAVADGEVYRAELNPGSGNFGIHARIRHSDGYRSVYAHMKSLVVSVGQPVVAGELIGLADSTGNSTGSHLHFALKLDGGPYTDQYGTWPWDLVDPEPFLWAFLEDFNAYPGTTEGYLWAAAMDVVGDTTAVAMGNLNMRQQPSSASQKIGTVPWGSIIKILDPTLYGAGYYLCAADVEGATQPPGDFDLKDYIIGDGRIYMVKNASGSSERFQSQLDADGYYQTKNRNWEQFIVDNLYIYRDVDTSPSENRYYRQIEGVGPARWMPRNMSVGDSFTVGLRVQFYNQSNCTESAPNSGEVVDTRIFVAHHSVYTFRTGFVLHDVIEILWTQGERYFYAKNYGLVGWEREHIDPNTPEWSAIDEEIPDGTQEDNKRVPIPCLS